MTTSEKITIVPDKLVYGGEAMGRLPDGRAVFVPYSLPGEEISIQVVEEKRGFARGKVIQTLETSPERIDPVCAHFGVCGGCHYQHMPYFRQVEAKAQILTEQMERIAGLTGPPVKQTVPSPRETHYRNHIQFHLTEDGRVGYLKPRSDEVLPIKECHLPQHPLNDIWPSFDFESNRGLDRLGLRAGTGDDVQIVLGSSDLEAPEILVDGIDASLVHLSPAGPLVLAGSEYIWMDVLDRRLRVSAGTFFQINTQVAAVLVKHIVDGLSEYSSLTNKTVLLDLYCGGGLFSLFLAPIVGRVVGVESSPGSAEDFAVNLDEFEGVELYEAEVEKVLPNLDLQPDITLIDPPRSGISRKAMDGLLKMKSRTLVYISCDPATLARDARRLITAGYQILQITPFDMHPQTFHIESVSFWNLT